MNIPLEGEKKRKKLAGKNFPTCYPWQRGAVVKGPTFRADSPGSTLSLAVCFFFAQFFSRFVFVFFSHIFPLWLISLYSYCWPIIASRGFYDKRISIAYVAAGPPIVYFNDIIYFKNHRFRVIGTQARNVYSYLEKGVRKKCARHNPER